MSRRKHHPDQAKPIPFLRGDLGLSKIGAARFDLRDPYHLAVSLSWPAFCLALLAVWLTINLMFAALYVISPDDITNARPGNFSDVFFFSIETLATVGYGVMAPTTLYGHIVSAAEIVTGTAFTAIVTGLLFVRFSRPKAKIIYAENAVVTRYDGQPTLMLRLANGRLGVMTSATARLFTLLAVETVEGHTFRRIHELKLQQPHLPLFVMPWVLMHTIDHDSPLHELTADAAEETAIRLFLTIEARDQALATMVHDVRDYKPADIRFGARFANIITLDETGRATADLRRISALEPDGPPD